MSYLCVLLFVIGFCGCLARREDYGHRNRHESYRNHDQLYYNIVGSDYREGKEDIWRPCRLDDHDCMGQFLSSNSHCVPANGHTPDPLRLPVEKFYFPVAKMTITHLGVEIRGFKHAKVTEFFVNKATGNVVIAVTIPTYNFTADSFFSYQREAKEPIALTDYNTFESDKVVLTAAIPKIHKLRLDLADVHADIPDVPARYYIGPGAYKSHDPAVKTGFAKFEGNVVQVIREASIVHSYFLMATYIQSELCDFGFDSYKNYNGLLMFRRGYTRY